MSGEAPTYSVSLTSDDMRAMRDVLYRFCECQNQAFDSSAKKWLGLERRPSQTLLLTISLVGALGSTLLLAMTTSDEVLGRVFLGSLAMILWLFFAALLVLGLDRLKAIIRKRFTDPFDSQP